MTRPKHSSRIIQCGFAGLVVLAASCAIPQLALGEEISGTYIQKRPNVRPATSTYELEWSYYDGFGDKTQMRQETLYERTGQTRRPIQTRIYLNSTNELREAAFLNRRGKWQYDPDTSSKFVTELVNRSNRGAKRTEVSIDHHPTELIWDQPLPNRVHVDPAVDFPK